MQQARRNRARAVAIAQTQYADQIKLVLLALGTCMSAAVLYGSMAFLFS